MGSVRRGQLQHAHGMHRLQIWSIHLLDKVAVSIYMSLQKHLQHQRVYPIFQSCCYDTTLGLGVARPQGSSDSRVVGLCAVDLMGQGVDSTVQQG